MQVTVTESFQWNGMQLYSNYILVQNADARNLLACHWVSLIHIFYEFDSTENVLKIVWPSNFCVIFIYLPPLYLSLALNKLIYFSLTERLAVLIIWTTFLSMFSWDVLAIESSTLKWFYQHFYYFKICCLSDTQLVKPKSAPFWQN